MSKRRRLRRRSKKGDRKADPTTTSMQTRFAAALMDQSENRQASLKKAADELRAEMETQSLRVRDLIVAQPPIQLLGYVQAQMHMDISTTYDDGDHDASRAQKEIIRTYQFVLEYLHAVWCCHSQLPIETAAFDEQKAGELLETLKDLERTTGMYCMVSSGAAADVDRGHATRDTEFQAKSTWTLIRGNRYQVLEEEFFRFVLAPHSDVLQTTYGMAADAIAAEIQAIADSMRSGFSEAMATIEAGMKRTETAASEANIGLHTAIEKLRESDGSFTKEISGAIHDIFHGGICNLSRHTKFSPPLLEDLSYVPGGNTEFFAEGDFKGTPMRTLPARIRPGIKLGDDYYVTDGQFVRDSAYRAIQRGLIARQPSYREDWNKRQKSLSERAYPTIFSRQLAGATVYSDVYFKDSNTGQWVETDLVMSLADILFIIEAKAGVMAMHSPATNFDSHESKIRELILKAYQQCKRFLDYLASAPQVSVYARVNGNFVETGRLRQRGFRLVLPIGLTMEAFTPFSAMAKENPEIKPLLDKHPFISMSVDDLFVLNRFLPTTGALLHYLEVRQAVAGIPRAMLFDEIDHLGAYITKNRFDISIREQLQKADMVSWDSFDDVVDKHFVGDEWKTAKPAQQEFPEALTIILLALDQHRPRHWLLVDACIRNLGGDGREDFARIYAELEATLQEFPMRRFLIGGEESPLLVWLCRRGSEPSEEETRYHSEVSCLAIGASRIAVLRLSFESDGRISSVGCDSFASPSIIQTNYPELMREAERQRGRLSDRTGKRR